MSGAAPAELERAQSNTEEFVAGLGVGISAAEEFIESHPGALKKSVNNIIRDVYKEVDFGFAFDLQKELGWAAFSAAHYGVLAGMETTIDRRKSA